MCLAASEAHPGDAPSLENLARAFPCAAANKFQPRLVYNFITNLVVALLQTLS